MLIILGFLIIICGSILECYCSFGRQARPDVQPHVFKTWVRFVLEGFWIFLLLVGAVLLFLVSGNFYFLTPLIGIVLFWVVLPFIINPVLRRRLLPPWDEVKKELGPKGYNERNYWRGNWWIKGAKVKRKKT
jgi:hypothetical protein